MYDVNEYMFNTRMFELKVAIWHFTFILKTIVAKF